MKKSLGAAGEENAHPACMRGIIGSVTEAQRGEGKGETYQTVNGQLFVTVMVRSATADAMNARLTAAARRFMASVKRRTDVNASGRPESASSSLENCSPNFVGFIAV